MMEVTRQKEQEQGHEAGCRACHGWQAGEYAAAGLAHVPPGGAPPLLHGHSPGGGGGGAGVSMHAQEHRALQSTLWIRGGRVHLEVA